MRPNEMFINLLRPQLKVGSMTGGVTSSVGEDTIITFTQSGSISFLGYGTASLLIVGGGAGGAKANLVAGESTYAGRGGYGGEVILYNNYYLETSSFSITIGTGGLGRTSVGPSQVGNATLFGTYSAAGGRVSSLSNATYGYTDAITPGYRAAGGGGSDGLQLGSAGIGGRGITSSITGSSVIYGFGGGGGAMTTGSQFADGGAAGTNLADVGDGGNSGSIGPPDLSTAGKNGIYGGGGGGGASHTTNLAAVNTNGGNGGDGIVIVRFTRK